MDFEQEFRAKFGDKFEWLSLKDIVVKKNEGVCTITFLEPSTCEGVSDDDKQEIISWIKQKLELEQLQLKVKFLKVYVEERLILKAVKTFFEKKYKLITSYLNDESFAVKITPIDVEVQITLSARMINFFAEHKISAELAKYLKNSFLVEFVITLIESAAIIDEVDIENVKMRTALKPIQRYNVEIIKEIVGTGIMPKPEYLSFIKSAKDSVIVAGFIHNLERKDYVVKSGKNVGQSRTYFSFVLEDEKGKIDCIHFCSKKNVAQMEELEECMFVLLHGDVNLNKLGKLCLYVDKLALASKIEEEVVEVELPKHDKNVVEIEKLLATEQDSMFGQQVKYNDTVAGKDIVVFDIETTGLDDQNDQIIELGAVKVSDGNIVEKFSTFVKPTKRIPYEVEKLTGITQDMVEDAPPVEWVIEEFYEFTRGCTLCGHNVIGFDIKFIRREGNELGLDFDNPIVDTLNLARASKLKTTRFNLGTVTKLLGISLEGAHRAWNDAYATAQVLLKLSEKK